MKFNAMLGWLFKTYTVDANGYYDFSDGVSSDDEALCNGGDRVLLRQS